KPHRAAPPAACSAHGAPRAALRAQPRSGAGGPVPDSPALPRPLTDRPSAPPPRQRAGAHGCPPRCLTAARHRTRAAPTPPRYRGRGGARQLRETSPRLGREGSPRAAESVRVSDRRLRGASHLPGRAPPPGSCGAKPPLPRGCVPAGWGERERSSPGAAAAARRRWPGLGAAPPADGALGGAGGADGACFRPAQQPPSAPPRPSPVAAERPRRAPPTAGPYSGAPRRLPRETGRSRRSAAAMLSVFRSIPTQMDYKGQKLAEQIFQGIILVSAVIGFIYGYITEQFGWTVYIVMAGFALSCLLTLPPWPMYRRNPLKWLPVQESGTEEKKAADRKPKRHSKT
uniref:Signal peptidase complex subunit 1 n=5 Tax=Passeriformes TaxID=9126 RepID=A0A8C5J6X2_JUNHY